MCIELDKTSAIIVLIVGILYLLQDIGTISFWIFNWFTVLFVLLGLYNLIGKK